MSKFKFDQIEEDVKFCNLFDFYNKYKIDQLPFGSFLKDKPSEIVGFALKNPESNS